MCVSFRRTAKWIIFCCCSVAQSWLTLCSPMNCSTPGFPVLHRLLEFTHTHVHWVSDAIQPSHLYLPLLLLPSIFPSIKVISMSWLLAPSAQSIGASASVLPMNTQGWSPLGWTGLVSLLSKGLSRVSSSITVQKHQFFSIRPSLLPRSHIHTWLLEKP